MPGSRRAKSQNEVTNTCAILFVLKKPARSISYPSCPSLHSSLPCTTNTAEPQPLAAQGPNCTDIHQPCDPPIKTNITLLATINGMVYIAVRQLATWYIGAMPVPPHSIVIRFFPSNGYCLLMLAAICLKSTVAPSGRPCKYSLTAPPM